MSFRLLRSLAVAAPLAAALLASSCARAPEPPVERLAIVRFENLTPDDAPDWMGRAFAEVITAELSGPTGLYAIPSSRLRQFGPALGMRPTAAPGISTEAPSALAAGATRIGYGTYAIVRGRLRARLTIRDTATHRAIRPPLEVVVETADVIGAATALARSISPRAQRYGANSEAALQAYARAIDAGDAGGAIAAARQAIADDPDFGPPYALIAELQAQQQDRAGAESMLRAGLARSEAMPPLDRVRLAMLDGSLRGDSAALGKALELYAQSAPLDPSAWRAVASMENSRHRYEEALAAYQRAAGIEPEDATTWNEMAYSAAYLGKFDVARAAVARYQQLRPAEANPLDTMGDVELMAGRLAEAERLYLEAHKKNPQFLGGADLFKAAMARLMTGDVKGADQIAGASESLASNADWLWLTGRRKEAFAKLSQSAAGLPRDAQARSYSELTLWALLLGDRGAAARAAQQAVSVMTPATAPIVAVARFIALPPAEATEWRARAAQMFPNAPPNSLKDYALAYALLLSGQFEAAAPVLEQLEAHAPPNGDQSTAIELAWALVETGRLSNAAPLLRLNPTPNFSASSIFVPLYFPRLFQLRAAVAEHAGNAAEAKENRRIYQALGGS